MIKKNYLKKKQLLLVLESAPNMIWRANLNAKCDYFNKTWLIFTGRTMEQELHDGWTEGVHKDDLNYCIKIYLEAFDKREPFKMIYRLRRNDGIYCWIEDTGTPYYDDNGEFQGYIGSCVDVTSKIEAEQVKDLALKDNLTGLVNRAYFEKLLQKEFENSKIFKYSFSIIMLDIDKFKLINDKYGHSAGDKVLKSFASILNSTFRRDDIVCRYGGDEFIILLPKTTIDIASEVADRLKENIEKNILKLEKFNIKFTASIGITQYYDEDEPSKIIEKSDKAMYNSKRLGFNLISRI